MANVKISGLPSATTPLTGAELVPIVQGGVTSQTTLAAMPYVPTGTGAVTTTVQTKLRETVSVKDFGAVGDGVTDDTAAIQNAVNAGVKIYFPSGTYLLSSSVSIRASGKTLDGTGANIILGSSTAGFQIAGDNNTIIGFNFTQSSTSYTPTAIYIFNDVTTLLTNYSRVIDIKSTSVYRSLHFYMGNTAVNAAAYRHLVYNCNFQNFYLQKTWSGSFGISFDGPGAGNAAGNDSRCVTCMSKGYEYNYIVNNSINTEFLACSGDGGGSCFKYAGSSSGLRIIGGYYEYNTYWLNVTDSTKYDAYILYPSVANTVTSNFTGNTISFISGGYDVGTANPTDIKNGAFQTNANGTAEVYAYNGINFYTTAGKALKLSISTSGDLTASGTAFLPGGISTDSIRGYTGGATPLRIQNTSTSVGSKLVFGANSTDRVEIPYAGNLRPTTDNSISLGESSNRWTVVYAATGTINTSDERSKQDITDLNDAERRVAVTLKGLVKKFRFKDAVQSKGDGARIHIGVIAQEVVAAFDAEGLDATKYGLLCYDEWEATDDIPAGNRYGIRYEELLAFIISAL